jgi:TonB family protein
MTQTLEVHSSLDSRQRRELNMTELWKQQEGKLIDEQLQLKTYLGGHGDCAVFSTEYGDRNPQKAAIKLIVEDPATADDQLHRWRMAQTLSHPHLCQLLEVGRCQLGELRVIYVVMDYAEENLSQVLAERALTSEEVVEILGPALSALAYTHAQGFVHANLKPANFLAVDGGLKLSTDGLCRTGESKACKSDVYAPPEILSSGPSPAGDAWSLGMTLVEALAQRLPSIMPQQDPVLPGLLKQPVLDIVRNCLRWDPRNRWSVTELARRLRAGVNPAPAELKPEAPADKRWAYVSAVVLAVALAGIAIFPRVQNPRPIAPHAPSVLLDAPRDQAPPVQKAAKSEEVYVAAVPAPSATETREAKPSPAESTDTQDSASRFETKLTEVPSTSPDIVKQMVPMVSSFAKGTIQGKISVRVKVAVDTDGNVVDAAFGSPSSSKYFSSQALEAARQSKFAPSTDGAVRHFVLLFRFRKAETNIIAKRVSG